MSHLIDRIEHGRAAHMYLQQQQHAWYITQQYATTAVPDYMYGNERSA